MQRGVGDTQSAIRRLWAYVCTQPAVELLPTLSYLYELHTWHRSSIVCRCVLIQSNTTVILAYHNPTLQLCRSLLSNR